MEEGVVFKVENLNIVFAKCSVIPGIYNALMPKRANETKIGPFHWYLCANFSYSSKGVRHEAGFMFACLPLLRFKMLLITSAKLANGWIKLMARTSRP